MRISLIVWVKTSLTWCNVLNFTLYNNCRKEIKERMKALEEARRKATDETDPIEKQKALILCTIEHQALKKAAQNIGDVSAKLNVILEFLGDINSQVQHRFRCPFSSLITSSLLSSPLINLPSI